MIKTPSSLLHYCNIMGISISKFYEIVEPMRDLNAWQKSPTGEWSLTSLLEDTYADSISLFTMQSDDHIYSPQNRRLYFNPENPPESRTVSEFNTYSSEPYCV